MPLTFHRAWQNRVRTTWTSAKVGQRRIVSGNAETRTAMHVLTNILEILEVSLSCTRQDQVTYREIEHSAVGRAQEHRARNSWQ